VRPVRLALDPEQLATAETPRELALPSPLIERVIQSGQDSVVYTIAVCSGAPPVVGGVTHSTGFADVDRFLDTRIAELGLDLPSAGCATVTIILLGFERACELPVRG